MNDSRVQTCAKQDCVLPASLFGKTDPYVYFLLKHRDRLFYLKAWSGNSGDELIWRGTEYLFDCLGLRRTVDPREAEIILIPGGNQTMWQGNIDTWNQVRTRYPAKAFVVGPTTVHFGMTRWDRDIKTPGARVLAIFARDPQSYANLRAAQLDPEIRIGLSHDPALALCDSEWIRRHRAAATEEHVLVVFRADIENMYFRRPFRRLRSMLLPHCVFMRREARRLRRSLDTALSCAVQSTHCTQPLLVCDVSLCGFEYFVETIRSAAEVHTDRLHCMLLAAMLGKRVFAYPTSHGKLEQVYVHSIEKWANVDFVSYVSGPEMVGPTPGR
jgi:exopolysaccharide biosynthesis predicted pyruvyltransferase EpsI